ncbi:hypothetical protein HanXRQr2_Chr11g0516651 [Helianthus annuus]|uniref:Uncharacterized protein n=1 Tax=Helianthus annuus TaxID=4232 RepID=A0A9K3N249_HELAN|nr:hypothetical protein HanXRQr2_Chr11g0516651 [Helianthus annuus]
MVLEQTSGTILAINSKKRNLYGSKLNALNNKPAKLLITLITQYKTHRNLFGGSSSSEFPNLYFHPTIISLSWKSFYFRPTEWVVGVFISLWSNNGGLRSY